MKQAQAEVKGKDGRERDRILYVALTRAAERLILAYTNTSRPGPWPNLILQGLDLTFPPSPQELSNEFATLKRVAGAPPAPPAPELQTPASPIEIEPLTPHTEAPAEIAVTSLAVFAQCPRRYLLDSRLRWPLPPSDGTGAIELGTEVHEYLAGLRADVSSEARRLAQAFEHSELARRAAGASTVRREMDFLVEIEDTLLRGQIDLWFDEGLGPVLVDYKTDRHLSAARLRGYELQMRLYAAALQHLMGKQVREAWLFPLRQPQPHAVDVSAAAIEDALATLRQWRAAERSGNFPLHETEDCRWCPYVSGPCPARPGPAEGL
jgi:ATP-dependent exoDNAse (exonuclease V) beta subunit